ncbi:hypothetical protein AVEN_166372-1 [Araneus ventricosus]|uniref:Uncharacterized protein n=1 Tax=Araneus ventricosus TaxID=182803 RepID=A0A4Y2SQX9_ARAVE|nr:hypothetical protein AVEN_166372-1 [Araneus ventricosus]
MNIILTLELLKVQLKTFIVQNIKLNYNYYADKRPSSEHGRRFYFPECNEVAVLIAGEEHGKKDIVIKTRGNRLQFIDETHRSYDSLQYPLLFPYVEDGYHFGILQAGGIQTKQFLAWTYMLTDLWLEVMIVI